MLSPEASKGPLKIDPGPTFSFQRWWL